MAGYNTFTAIPDSVLIRQFDICVPDPFALDLGVAAEGRSPTWNKRQTPTHFSLQRLQLDASTGSQQLSKFLVRLKIDMTLERHVDFPGNITNGLHFLSGTVATTYIIRGAVWVWVEPGEADLVE